MNASSTTPWSESVSASGEGAALTGAVVTTTEATGGAMSTSADDLAPTLMGRLRDALAALGLSRDDLTLLVDLMTLGTASATLAVLLAGWL